MYHVISITVEPLKTWAYLSYGPFCLSQLESPRNISIYLCPIHEQESKERQLLLPCKCFFLYSAEHKKLTLFF
jgi:hypothetical protein